MDLTTHDLILTLEQPMKVSRHISKEKEKEKRN
jgi:hypothetical protein